MNATYVLSVRTQNENKKNQQFTKIKLNIIENCTAWRVEFIAYFRNDSSKSKMIFKQNIYANRMYICLCCRKGMSEIWSIIVCCRPVDKVMRIFEVKTYPFLSNDVYVLEIGIQTTSDFEVKTNDSIWWNTNKLMSRSCSLSSSRNRQWKKQKCSSLWIRVCLYRNSTTSSSIVNLFEYRRASVVSCCIVYNSHFSRCMYPYDSRIHTHMCAMYKYKMYP